MRPTQYFNLRRFYDGTVFTLVYIRYGVPPLPFAQSCAKQSVLRLYRCSIWWLVSLLVPSHSAIVTMTTLVISTTACFNLTHLSSVLAILFESMWQQSALIEIMSAGTLSFCIAPWFSSCVTYQHHVFSPFHGISTFSWRTGKVNSSKAASQLGATDLGGLAVKRYVLYFEFCPSGNSLIVSAAIFMWSHSFVDISGSRRPF